MKHIRNSIKNSIFLLEHTGVPTTLFTDFSEEIKNGSICIDTTNQDIYILKNNTWVKFGAGFNIDDWIPREGTFINKPVYGDIEITDGNRFYSGQSEIIFSDSQLVFGYNSNIPFSDKNYLLLDRNTIFATENSILNVDSASKNNFINKVINKNVPGFSLTNTSDNFIESIINTSISFSNFNRNTVKGNFGMISNFANYSNSNIDINSPSVEVNLLNGNENNIILNISQTEPFNLISNTFLTLKGRMIGYNNNIQNTSDSFMEGSFKNLTQNNTSYIHYYGNINEVVLTNVESLYNIGNLIGKSNGNLTSNASSPSIITNSDNIFNLGVLEDIEIISTSNSIFLGYNNNIKINESNHNFFVNNNDYHTITSQKNLFINNNTYDYILNQTHSQIINSNKNIYINNDKINSIDSKCNFVVNTHDIDINGENNFIFPTNDFTGKIIGNNNTIFSLESNKNLNIHNNVFTFGNINSSSGAHIYDGNVLIGQIEINPTLTTNNQIFGAKELKNINHSGQNNNIFLNVDEFNVPDSNTVYLPYKFYSINLGNYGLFDTSNISENRYWNMPDQSGTVALLSDIVSPPSSTYYGTNGITITGSKVKLGGILSEDTIINGTNFDITFNVNDFIVNASTNSIILKNNNIDGLTINSEGLLANNNLLFLNDGEGIKWSNNSVKENNNSLEILTDNDIKLKKYLPLFNDGGSGFVGAVHDTIIQSDGKILVGGNFTTYNGVNCSDYLVRLNTNGTIDSSFNISGIGFNNNVNTIAIQSDGKILVGGTFTTYNGINCTDYLVRLNTNGSIDSSFNVGGLGFDNNVNTIAIQSDGKILIGGNFTKYNSIDCSAYLIRLNSDGSIDSLFNTSGIGFNNNVNTIAIQSDGKILVGGNFTKYNSIDCSAYLIRLNSDGSIDSLFNAISGFDSIVNKIILQNDGKILVGGNFTTYNGVNCSDRLVRLKSDGILDSLFNTNGIGFNNIVRTIALYNNGDIIVGGNFTTYNSINYPHNIIRLNVSGLIFNSIEVNFNSTSGIFEYDKNYHNFYTKRSLVDKEYVDFKAPIVNIAYDDLYNSWLNGSLITGNYYSFDYQTIHRIPYTTDINYGAFEKLIVLAVAPNKLDKIAHSPQHPYDIIYYRIDDNIVNHIVDSSMFTDFNKGEPLDDISIDTINIPTGINRPGRIYYREDTIYRLSTPYDFRNVKFRRWHIEQPYTVTSIITPQIDGQVYSVGDMTTSGSGIIFMAVENFTFDTVGTNLYNTNFFKNISNVLTNIELKYSPTPDNYEVRQYEYDGNSLTLKVDNSKYFDLTTFNNQINSESDISNHYDGLAYNVEIEDNVPAWVEQITWEYYPNIILSGYTNNIKIGIFSENITLVNVSNANIGDYCKNIYVVSTPTALYQTSIGDKCVNVLIKQATNTIETSYYGEAHYLNIGDVNINILLENITNTEIGIHNKNIYMSYGLNNKLGNNNNFISLTGYNYYNVLGSNNSFIALGSNAYKNKLGDNNVNIGISVGGNLNVIGNNNNDINGFLNAVTSLEGVSIGGQYNNNIIGNNNSNITIGGNNNVFENNIDGIFCDENITYNSSYFKSNSGYLYLHSTSGVATINYITFDYNRQLFGVVKYLEVVNNMSKLSKAYNFNIIDTSSINTTLNAMDTTSYTNSTTYQISLIRLLLTNTP